MASPDTSNESVDSQHGITLIGSSWSSADKDPPPAEEDLTFVMFGAWMEHSVFFAAISRGHLSGEDYNSNLSMAGGELSNSRPTGNATWQGFMVGTPATGAGRSHSLRGDTTLTYSLDTRMLNAAFTNIYNLDTEAAHSVPSVEFTGVPVHGQGQFQSEPSGGTAS